MPNDFLLIPGTGGTRLKTDQGVDLGYPIRMKLGALTGGLVGKSPAELGRLLSMEHQPGQLAPVKSSLEPGISIVSGDVLDVAYNQIPNTAKRFVYDWRADLEFNARRLKDFLDQTPPGKKWDIVAHSQGGLLVILASKLMAAETDFAKVASTVFLVGVPLAGTVNSATALITGSNLGESAAPIMKKVMRTWPALYQMLPAWPMVRMPNGRLAPPEKQHYEPSGWNGHGGISVHLLQRMRDTHKKLRDPMSHLDDVHVFWMLASNRDTTVMLKRSGGKISSAKALGNKGDTLVPYNQSISWLGNQIAQFVVNYTSTVNEHSMMLNDPKIVTDIENLR